MPQQITNLIGKVDNVSSICLRWKKPNIVNGQLQKYVISYSYSNQSLEHWSTVILPAEQAMLHVSVIIVVFTKIHFIFVAIFIRRAVGGRVLIQYP